MLEIVAGGRPAVPKRGPAPARRPAGSFVEISPVLPTEKELAELPRWAIVSFAARCAQRARPHFAGGPEEAATVDRAISVAETSVTKPPADCAYSAARASAAIPDGVAHAAAYAAAAAVATTGSAAAAHAAARAGVWASSVLPAEEIREEYERLMGAAGPRSF